MTELRYGRVNRRYKVKKPREKIPKEKILVTKSMVSAVLFALLWVLSCFNPSDRISRVLYESYTAKDWKKLVSSTSEYIYSKTSKAVSDYMGIMSDTEKSVGIDSDATVSYEAKADTTAQEETDISPIPQKEWRPPLWSEISSEFGERTHPVTGDKTVHTGVDIAADEGTPVVAASQGTVTTVEYDDANGNYIIVDHGDGITTVYAHLKCALVNKGDVVSYDSGIALVGSTGISTGPHLHFEIKENGKSVNPRKYVFFKEG